MTVNAFSVMDEEERKRFLGAINATARIQQDDNEIRLQASG